MNILDVEAKIAQQAACKAEYYFGPEIVTRLLIRIWNAFMNETKLKPLSVIPNSRIVRLVRINAGRGLNARLASMGLFPNVEVKVINNGHPGPFVVSVKDSKIALGHGMANKIMVSEI